MGSSNRTVRLFATAVATFGLAAVVSHAQAKDDALLAAATAEKPALVSTLEKLVNIETGTGNAEGLATYFQLLEKRLQDLGFEVTRHKAVGDVVGDNLVATKNGKGQEHPADVAHGHGLPERHS